MAKYSQKNKLKQLQSIYKGFHNTMTTLRHQQRNRIKEIIAGRDAAEIQKVEQQISKLHE